MQKIIIIFSILISSQSWAKSVTLKSQLEGRTDVKVHLPHKFEKREKWPLIISLHGYGGNANIQKYYVRLNAFNNKFGYVYAAPNGLKNSEDKRFWNASNFCCDFEKTGVDDVAYIKGLISEISNSPKIGRIDLNRIYLIGYSNGAFLTNKILCSDEINLAGIVTISGTSDLRDENGKLLPLDKSLCEHNKAVPVLHVHGTADKTIPYQGFDNGKTGLVGALDQIKRFADQNGCSGKLIKKEKKLNATNFIKGSDTDQFQMEDCDAPVELFRINKGEHFGIFKRKFTKNILNFLFSK